MASTQYQILYRYYNSYTNHPITNDSDHEYRETFDFFNQEHKVYSNNADLQLQAEDQRLELLSTENSPDNVKNDMLFVYNGTQKVWHQKFVSKGQGYILKDTRLVKSDDIGAKGDFTKLFFTLEDNSVVLPTGQVSKFLQTYKDEIATSGGTALEFADKTAMTPEGLISAIQAKTYFTIDPDIEYTDFLQEAVTETKKTYWSTSEYKQGANEVVIADNEHNKEKTWLTLTGNITINKNGIYPGDSFVGSYSTNSISWVGSSGTKAWINGSETIIKDTHYYKLTTNLYEYNKEGAYSKTTRTITVADLNTVEIPEHTEPSTTTPYCIKDTYVRIDLTPWVVHSNTCSLKTAMERAKALIAAIGIEHVKVLKLVEYDQFLKIR